MFLRLVPFVLLALPGLSTSTCVALGMLLNPLHTVTIRSPGLWIMVILPFFASIAYAASWHSKLRGGPAGEFLPHLSWMLVTPFWLVIGAFMCMMVAVALHGGGSMMAWQ